MYEDMTGVKTSRSDRTRAKLIAVGRRLFGERGFAAVSAEEVVAAAGVTRGALYHHFDGKPGLFVAVLDAEMGDVQARLVDAGRGATSPLDAIERGLHAYLEACREPSVRQLLLIDGPAVLGWNEWRALDLQHGLGVLRRALGAAVDAGQIRVADLETMTHLVGGALVDGALLLGQSPADRDLAARVEASLVSLVRGLSGS
jgi:AcrR family transcriptional regulator